MKCLTFLLLVSGFWVVLLTLISPRACLASSMTTSSLGMSMAESDMDLEFLMGSEFGRLLVSSSGYSYDAAKLNNQATFGCGRGQRYCLPTKNPSSAKNRCGAYNRACH